jgi:hypothetical protein
MAGDSPYAAKAGITVWLDGVFQVDVLGVRADGLVRMRNRSDVGRTELPEVEAAIEPDLLYPYVPWRDVQRWVGQPDRYLLVLQDPAARAPYPLDMMRARWPHTLAYLNRFEPLLRQRSGYRRYFRPTDPFYAIYNVSSETVSVGKVVWRTMGSAMQAAALTEGTVDGVLPAKPLVFKNTTIFVSVDSVEEAHYLVAALNCSWTNWFLRACNVRGGKSSFATNVLRTIRIPAYNRRSDIARRLSSLGERAADEAQRRATDELDVTEIRIDEAAARLWELSERNQQAMRESLQVIDGVAAGAG